jgi:hypothetical protein
VGVLVAEQRELSGEDTHYSNDTGRLAPYRSKSKASHGRWAEAHATLLRRRMTTL